MKTKLEFMKHTLALLGAVIVLSASLLVLSAPAVSAQTLVDDAKCQGTAEECVPEATDNALTADPAKNLDCDGTPCNAVTKYLNPFIKLLTYVVAIAVVMGIIVGGIQYSSSAGDPQKAAAAKRHIRIAIIALLAYFFLWAFIRFLTPGGAGVTG